MMKQIDTKINTNKVVIIAHIKEHIVRVNITMIIIIGHTITIKVIGKNLQAMKREGDIINNKVKHNQPAQLELIMEQF